MGHISNVMIAGDDHELLMFPSLPFTKRKKKEVRRNLEPTINLNTPRHCVCFR